MKHYNVSPLGFAKAVANCTAAYDIVEATYQTPLRPAALIFCDAADKALSDIAQGNVVEYLAEPGVFGVVLATFDGHEFRADMHGVDDWGKVRPARLPTTFTRRAVQRRVRAMVLRYKEINQWAKVSPWTWRLAHLAKREAGLFA